MLDWLTDVNRSAAGPDQSHHRRAATREETRALAHPLRLRIIRLLYDGPMSNRELATRLDQQPATVLHHVRTLLRTGFIAPAGQRPGARGTTEKLYASTGKSWTLSVGDDGVDDATRRASIDAFVAEIDEAGDDVYDARLALRISPARLEELKTRIGALLDELAFRDDPDGEKWAIFVAIHRRP